MNINVKLISRNYTAGRPTTPSFVIIHTYNGRGTSLFNWFEGNNLNVSSHYAVLKDGNVEQYVREEDTAHHAGNWTANQASIGIEHQDDGNYADAVRTDALYNSSIMLIASLYTKYNWDKKNQGLIKPHKEYASTGCPGGLDINRIRAGVYSMLNPLPQTSSLEVAHKKLQEEKEKAIKELQLQAETKEKEYQELKNKIKQMEIEKQVVETEKNKLINSDKELIVKYGTTLAVEVIKSTSIPTKYANMIEKITSNKFLLSFFKYDLFVLLGVALSYTSIQTFAFLPTEIAGAIALISGVIIKLIVANYDTNKDGKITKLDLINKI